ncbi:MAG: chemotaxis response regulator protein-glutamate methylesterase [Deltaproteobacteria bacterium]|nr:chemotaxis response regulator protein-glutamate methylesterase [Deltaproteobacteria bacterium]
MADRDRGRPVRVLVVDDSALVRRALARGLSAEPGIEIIGTAPDAFVARDLIVRRAPDVVTLDLELPRLDGLTFLRRLMRHHPLPVIVLSSFTPKGSAKALDAMAAGAVEVVCKPLAAAAAGALPALLAGVIKNVGKAKVAPSRARPAVRAPEGGAYGNVVAALGASTGGTVALEEVLRAMPADALPLVITQHLPAMFSAAFAERLARAARLDVRVAKHGDKVQRGVALVAPGDHHLRLCRGAGGLWVSVTTEPPVNRHRPSVDVLFQSAAESAGANAVGVLLTGMGADGAQGLLAMRRAGAATLVQDEASSVVFGMPRAAIELGAAERVTSLCELPAVLLSLAVRQARR